MENIDDKIYLDQEGYNQYLKEIENLKIKLKNNGRVKSESHTGAVGDGWHDNFEFEESKRQELKIMGELEAALEKLSKIVIINEVINEDLININDYVTVRLEFDENDIEEISFRLVGTNGPNSNAIVEEISLNSPLGKSVYHKKIGDKGNYIVNNNSISYIITDIMKYGTNAKNEQEDQTSIRRGK